MLEVSKICRVFNKYTLFISSRAESSLLHRKAKKANCRHVRSVTSRKTKLCDANTMSTERVASPARSQPERRALTSARALFEKPDMTLYTGNSLLRRHLPAASPPPLPEHRLKSASKEQNGES